jgi:D-alanyl-D-alanine carboxypeptidase
MNFASSAALGRILDRFIESTANARGVIAAALVGDDEVWTGASGHDGTGAVMRPDATFRIASITKTFTATSVLRLVEQGAISAVDDPISPHVDSALLRKLCVVDGNSYGEKITFRHLLQHTSGINAVDAAEVEDVFREEIPDWARPRDQIGQIEFAVASGPAYGRPGEVFHYSDTNYVLLTLIVEDATGMPWSEALRKLARFDELGLTVLHLEKFEPKPAKSGPMMRHFVRDLDLTDIDPTFDLYGSGGLVSDCMDLARWWQALFEGRILEKDSSLLEMQRVISNPGGAEVGLGLFRRIYDGLGVWYHSGAWGSFALHQPETGVTLAAATNQAIDTLPEGAFEHLRGELLVAASSNR